LTPEDKSSSDEALTRCQSPVELSPAAELMIVEPIAKISVKNAVNSLYPENNQSNNQILRNVISVLKLSPFDVDIDFKDGFNQKITALTTTHVEDMELREVKKIKLSTPYDKSSSWTNCIHVNNPSCN
jgi:hypothetical protein